MYVAMTRPRNHLFVTYPLNVYDTRRGADYSMDQLSRFLDRGVREGMQRVVVDRPESAQPDAAPGSACPSSTCARCSRGVSGRKVSVGPADR